MNPETQALIDRARARNRANGLNVEWVREDGTVDEWSFSTAQRRDAFIRHCHRRGLDAKIASPREAILPVEGRAENWRLRPDQALAQGLAWVVLRDTRGATEDDGTVLGYFLTEEDAEAFAPLLDGGRVYKIAGAP